MDSGAAAFFDREFLQQTMMGPNCVRIARELTGHCALSRGMRVLDLGCGMGISSIFLARTFGVDVVAADLWIDPAENREKFRKFGLGSQVTAMRCEAHALPFRPGEFDALVSIDAYHYFGAKPGYLDRHIAPLLKKSGTIAVAVPGVQEEFKDGVPPELQPFWAPDMNFHSAMWWRDLWSGSERVRVEQVFSMKSHPAAWDDWLQCDNEHARSDIEMMEAEGGRYFDTIGMVATVL